MATASALPLFAVGTLQTIVEGSERDLTNTECRFLISKIRELERLNIGLDLAAQHWQEECRQTWLDLKGLQSEFGDLRDELARAEQNAELARFELESLRQAADAAT